MFTTFTIMTFAFDLQMNFDAYNLHSTFDILNTSSVERGSSIKRNDSDFFCK